MEFNISSSNKFASFWPIETFNENYKEEGIKSSSIATIFDVKFPDKTGLVILRSFIQKSERAKTDQKYIIGLRFYSFGDMATIDLISLDKEYHREICYDHLKRMNFPLWGEKMERVDYYEETTRSPFIFAGGHLKILEDDSIKFFGDSGDYSGKLLFSCSNSIARFIASNSMINSIGEKKAGQNFIEHILKFMFENKLKREFYQNFVADIFQKDEINLNSQNVGALIAMKVLDRYLMEEGDIFNLMFEEISGGGLARDIMLHSVAQKIKSKK